MAATESNNLFTQLPSELVTIILSHLTNREIKNLRAANRDFARVAQLRIRRVFLSANLRNIDVFRAVADHEALRHGVTEIIWDDARLKVSKWAVGDEGFYTEEDTQYDDSIVAGDDCPFWFRDAREAILSDFVGTYRLDTDELAKIAPKGSPSLLESWDYYKQLIQDQQAVLESGADVEALKHGLARFPSLRRITLIPTAHGSVGRPLYYTPMLRHFPKMFGYPFPQNWPGMECGADPADVYPWHGDEHTGGYGHKCTIEDYRNKWRGFRIVLRTLAENTHHITEFVMKTAHHLTGINCNIFSEPSQECDDLEALLSTPGFRRLDLALFTGASDFEE